MTWRDLIKLTLQDLRVYGAVGEVSAEDEGLALAALNDWLDGLKTHALSMYQQARTTWALTSAASYTIGIGATINVARPVTPAYIAGFAWLNNNLTPPMEFPLGPPLTDSQYQGIAAKTLVNTYPAGFYYDAAFDASGFGRVWPYPVVNGSGLLGVIYSGVPVDEVTVVTATILLPPGYRRFVRKSLAIEIASAFRVDVSREQKDEANDARGDVKRANERLDDMGFGVAGTLFKARSGTSNIYTGSE